MPATRPTREKRPPAPPGGSPSPPPVQKAKRVPKKKQPAVPTPEQVVEALDDAMGEADDIDDALVPEPVEDDPLFLTRFLPFAPPICIFSHPAKVPPPPVPVPIVNNAAPTGPKNRRTRGIVAGRALLSDAATLRITDQLREDAKGRRTIRSYNSQIKAITTYHREECKAKFRSTGTVDEGLRNALLTLSADTRDLLFRFMAWCIAGEMDNSKLVNVRAAYLWKAELTWNIDSAAPWVQRADGTWSGNPYNERAILATYKVYGSKKLKNHIPQQSLPLHRPDLDALLAVLARDALDVSLEGSKRRIEAAVLSPALIIGWTLWTRFQELAGLLYGDILFCERNGRKFAQVTLGLRKTDGGNRSKRKTYELHPQGASEICAYSALRSLVDERIKFEGEDRWHPEHYLLPSMDAKGTRRWAMSIDQGSGKFQSHIDSLVLRSGILRGRDPLKYKYTTHCLRRGGAQHCFIYRRPAWNLAATQWWGHWSEGKDTLQSIMRYLLETQDSLEHNYSDMLDRSRPTGRGLALTADLSLESADEPQEADDAVAVIPSNEGGVITLVQIHQLGDHVVSRIVAVTRGALQDVCSPLVSRIEELERLLAVVVAGNAALTAAITRSFAAANPHLDPALSIPVLPFAIAAPPRSPAAAAIPEVPNEPFPTIPVAKTYRQYLLDWEFSNPVTGPYVAMKDWSNPQWLKHPNYQRRRKLFIAWEVNCGRDHEKFIETYGGKGTGIQQLVESLRYLPVDGYSLATPRPNAVKAAEGAKGAKKGAKRVVPAVASAPENDMDIDPDL